MVEIPSKRPRRSDQDEDRRRDSPERNSRSARDRGNREDRDGRDRVDRDMFKERDRKYRSRSPERDRDRNSNRERDRDRHSEQGRGRGGRRVEPRDRDRDRDRDRERERDREPAKRDDRRGRDSKDSGTGARGRSDRDRDREQSYRKRPRGVDDIRRPSRSQSPARDVKARLSIERSPVPMRGLDIEAPREPKSRTATPPVTFKVGHGHSGAGHSNSIAQKDSNGHDRGEALTTYDTEAMDTDDPTNGDSTIKKSKGKGGKRAKIEEKSIEEDEDLVVEGDESMVAMQAMLGFGGFGTTKQKKVVGNDVYAVRKEKKTEYRQYMNRVGGFNRPLSPSRD